MGIEKIEPLNAPKSPQDYEKQKILELIKQIEKSDLVAFVSVIWASDVNSMAVKHGCES